MARRPRATSEIERVAPDDLALLVILADHAVAFVTNQIVAAVQLAGQPRVAMRLRMLHLQRHFLNNLPGAIDLDDSPIAAFGNHRQTVRQPLESMNLDPTRVRRFRLAFILPNDLL